MNERQNNATHPLTIQMMLYFFTLLLLLMGCGQSSNPVSDSVQGNKSEVENDWELGEGELSAQVGEKVELENFAIGNINEELFTDSGELAERTDYNVPTGKWFIDQGEGILDSILTAGVQPAGAEFYVSLTENGTTEAVINRDVRIQLTVLAADYTKGEQIIEETVSIDTLSDQEKIYSGILPETTNISYLLSAEVLNENGEIEDTKLAMIYVPEPEINARLSMDEDIYGQTEQEATLVVENFGPTILTLGQNYSIEKKVNDSWRKVPLDMAFIAILYSVGIGKEHEQIVDLSELNEGEYRIIKDIMAQDFPDLAAKLAVEFTIEE